MALYEVTLVQRYYGQECVNRWNYTTQSTGAGATRALALAWAFGGILGQAATAFTDGTIMRTLQAIQVTTLEYVSLNVRNIYDVYDFYETPYATNVAGGLTGEAASPVLAYGFISSRSRTDIRRGQKRFAGVSEGAMSPGGVLSGGVVANLNTLATLMSNPISYVDEGQTLSFDPVIVGKERYPVPDTSPVRYAYRYYETEVEQMEHIATSVRWQPYEQVRSQVSRQYNRGR